MKSHPIWIDVNDHGNYKTSKSFGGRNELTLNVCVGTSGTNSHEFCTIKIEHESHSEGATHGNYNTRFTLYIDGHEYKAAVVTDKKEYVPEREVVTTLSSDGKLTRLDK
jgi:hypothetical protein